MSQQLAEVARCRLSDEDVAAFLSTWQSLLRRTHRRFYWLDRAQIEDAIGDVIARRLRRAIEEDEEVRQKLVELSVHSLYSAVCRRLGNCVRADRRRQRREMEYARQRKKCFEEDFFVLNGLSAENICLEEQKDELERLLADSPDWERTFVMLRLQGTRDLRAYAEVLDVSPCPLEELQGTVDRAWGRLRMKLRRLLR